MDIIIESIYKPINLLFFNKLDENDINLDYDKFYEKYIFCRKFKNSLYNKFNVLIPSRLFTKIYNNYKKLYLSTLISIIYYKLIIKDDSIIDIEFIKYDNINNIDNIYVYDFVLNKHYYISEIEYYL